jgi:lipid A 4'-phosphatase
MFTQHCCARTAPEQCWTARRMPSINKQEDRPTKLVRPQNQPNSEVIPQAEANQATSLQSRAGFIFSSDIWLAVALTAALSIVSLFAALPSIDLAVSRMFFDQADGFFLQERPLVIKINSALKQGLEIFALVAVLTGLASVLPQFRRQARASWFFVLSFLVGPGLIVNLVLKANVGRARPRDVEEFGGDRMFTPILQVVDQCAQNCSFSSGEVAMTSTFVFALLTVLWSRLSPQRRLLAGVVGGSLIAVSAFLRIGLGAHFLSDTLASVAISGLVVLLAWRVTGLRKPNELLPGGPNRSRVFSSPLAVGNPQKD